MIPNEEHLQAENESFTKQLDEFKKTLSEKEAKKFDAVYEALDVLKKNNVIAYIHPLLKSVNLNNGKYSVYSFNTFTDTLYNFEDSGKMTQESKEAMSFYNIAFISEIYHAFRGMGAFRGNTLPEELQDFCKFVIACNTVFAQYCDKNKKDDE